MPSVLGRFQVVGVELAYDPQYEQRDGEWVLVRTNVSRKVTLQAVTSPPFGNATPDGRIVMLLRDPAVGDLFEQAFRAGAADPNRAKMDVLFTWNPDGTE